MAVHTGSPFVRAQVNHKVPYPAWVLSLPEVERQMTAFGYRLAYHAACADDWNVDSYDPAHRVPNSTTLLFFRV